jgi:sec-independent protein translocase protein TatA
MALPFLSGLLLNIAGSEWAIIILLALVLIFGPKRLPQFSRTIGRAVGEYEKARQTFQREMQEAAEQARREAGIATDPGNTAAAVGVNSRLSPHINIPGPVANERQKLELIATSLGIDHAGKTDDELRSLIAQKMNTHGPI